ncbi:thermonuclease family protein [Caldibacillus lycopersici]|uniref:Thermonuclease family protein n=1 Tax=Perspicuibacillus lycopersici TaxID=1325689 RepID=A0AAE3IPP5_9BACI|nr:thermonuclease family protein [Perspicuibacillus lycopersici]MCU9612305.1 thermonuclease family protein [Perspicuibacillus lycopersici]
MVIIILFLLVFFFLYVHFQYRHKSFIGLSIIASILFTGCAGTTSETEKPRITSETNSVGDPSDNINSTLTENEQTDPPLAIGKVTNVVDGDTLDITFENGMEERVRLVLVDTPETKHPSKPVQPFGSEATTFTKDLLTGKTVEVELDVQERDNYGRLLAYLYLDGKMVNKTLLEKGLARVAVYPPNTRYVDEFNEIQNIAKKQGIGIWSIENYVSDTGYALINSNRVEKPENISSDATCKNPTIKGNINSKEEKIYHIPSGQYYDVTKPEEVFCTEKEAINAGYRKSLR